MSTLELVFGGQIPAFLDDGERTAGQNGQPATANLLAKEIALANQIAHCGHPIYCWTQGDYATGITSTATEITSYVRQVYFAANKGAVTEGGETIALIHSVESSPGFQAGQGVDVTIGTQTTHHYENFSTTVGRDYPQHLNVLPLASTYGYSTVPAELIIGGVTSNWPVPIAGTYWQDPVNVVDSSKASSAGSADDHQQGAIVGVRATGTEQLTALTNVFRDTWFHQRPQGGWSALLPGRYDGATGVQRAVLLTTSTGSYRYIFDQTYGTGGSTITATSPAITLPLYKAGGGVSTQVRVYPFVYAAMSGVTDTGSIAVANKDSGGTMTTPTALTNGATISGTTFQWYPTLATWAATTAPYFLAYTGSAFDRVALCGRSNGTTNMLMIGAFTLVVAPATS